MIRPRRFPPPDHQRPPSSACGVRWRRATAFAGRKRHGHFATPAPETGTLVPTGGVRVATGGVRGATGGVCGGRGRVTAAERLNTVAQGVSPGTAWRSRRRRKTNVHPKRAGGQAPSPVPSRKATAFVGRCDGCPAVSTVVARAGQARAPVLHVSCRERCTCKTAAHFATAEARTRAPETRTPVPRSRLKSGGSTPPHSTCAARLHCSRCRSCWCLPDWDCS